MREVTAKATVTRCGLTIEKRDLPRFEVSIWAVDVDCPECLPKGT